MIMRPAVAGGAPKNRKEIQRVFSRGVEKAAQGRPQGSGVEKATRLAAHKIAWSDFGRR